MCKNHFQRQESRFSVSAGFELKVFLPQPPQDWEDRCVSVCRHSVIFSETLLVLIFAVDDNLTIWLRVSQCQHCPPCLAEEA